MKVTVMELPKNKYGIKASNHMVAKGFTIHNTYNDAKAENEIKYMHSNNESVSYHYAVDESNIIQGLPLDRNGWHAGDGSNGYGNRNTWGVEICYSKSGGERYDKAETNAIMFVAKRLHELGWGVDKVWKHQDWSGKYCPHRILDRSRGWEGIIKAIGDELKRLKGSKPSVKPKPEVKPTPPQSVKTIDELAKETIAGLHGTGDARKKSLGSQYEAVQKRVNDILMTPPKKKPVKSIDTLAREVIAGKHGNGDKRKQSLGSRYEAVQKRVNELQKATKPKKTLSQLVDEVNRGLHGTGEARKKSLGSDYNRVQAEINKMYK